jgi:type IV pilus assembly protein PilF
MKWISIMKWLVLATTAWTLAGCASNKDHPLDAERAKTLAKVRTELAADYYGRKQYSIALDELAKAMQADARYAPAYDVRALVHMALLEDAEAESDFRHSLDLDQSNPETHNNYGLYLCTHGHESDGIKHFLLAAKDPLYATPGTAYLNAGMCSKKIGRFPDAELFLQRAMILQPELTGALIEMSDLAFTIGDYPRAQSSFARYEKSAGIRLSAENLLLAVRIQHKLGNRSAEAAYAARLRKEFPDSRESAMLGQIR